MDMSTLIERERRVCAQNYAPLPVVLARGEGVWLWDTDGRRYLDMMSAYSAASHGHAHPRILQCLQKQAARLGIVSRAFHTEPMAPFFEKLCQLTGLDLVMPANTGAEAVEVAIKAARRWAYQHKKVPQDQAEIIVARNNFHGRTTTIISFSTSEAARRDFGPFTPGFKAVPFGDAAALEEAITPHTCAVLFEPIQGEAGIILPPAGYLKQVERICKKHNVLFLLDEIQSGLGRTGRMFAYEHEDVQPDGIMLGKALGGGVMPVSAFVAKREILELFTPGSHGSTWGGNPLAAAVGLEALTIVEEEQFAERSKELGCYLKESLESLESPVLTRVRGRGLWIGVDINPTFTTGHDLCIKLMQEGILAKETHEQTIRLAPPLIIDRETIDFAVERIHTVLAGLAS